MIKHVKHYVSVKSQYLHGAVKEYFFLMRQNAALFSGLALFLLGILNISRGKYCDGNPADYYSCTNPATYYYYSPFATILCILGVFCITLWLLKKSER